ncbi:bifunctional diaminohydroxyphosphoribosylaminopyrimidine deaminase/5-amino-6-(5-phosphoribosylamino)uracil reductase RibD [Micromonospora sp. NPDC049523]|uniref:bifunctional diaminohydroxyphosphoribosylaminopyrimidine deaminase/5-amino-6-(5-phosphoribosylamino)uracil reductase RibD n=1 Tax=Micromonospora sp. NPDC049523 TaxID=3155921 RepID=UPI0034156303
MASDVELAAMRQAITLSALGLGTASPNPPVGCVILDRHGTVVGAGFHRRKGEAHAEANALNAAGTAARGGTAVVTLEPCNHAGVTPACRQALLDAGIARVVISVIDPTSRGDGGAAVLAAAGVDVETGVLHDEALTVLGPWLTATVQRRPYLIWVYGAEADQRPTVTAQLLLALRGRADLVVANKVLEEGIPGGHAPAHYTLPPDSDLDADLWGWLSATYQAGTRTALIAGSEYAETLHQQMNVVDEIILSTRRTDLAEVLTALQPHAIPAGFQLVDVTPSARAVLARFRRPLQGQA